MSQEERYIFRTCVFSQYVQPCLTIPSRVRDILQLIHFHQGTVKYEREKTYEDG